MLATSVNYYLFSRRLLLSWCGVVLHSGRRASCCLLDWLRLELGLLWCQSILLQRFLFELILVLYSETPRCWRRSIKEVVNNVQPPINDRLLGQLSIWEDQLFNFDSLLRQLLFFVGAFAATHQQFHVVRGQIPYALFHRFAIWSGHYQEMVVLPRDRRWLIIHPTIFISYGWGWIFLEVYFYGIVWSGLVWSEVD